MDHDRRRTEQFDVIAATSVPLEDEDDPIEVSHRLAEARKLLAARRRRQRQH